MKEPPVKQVEASSEDSKVEDLELAIYDDQVTNDNSTLKRDFNVDDLIHHKDEDKLFNVPQRNMRRAMRLNSDTETYKKEFEVVKHTLKMRGVEEEIADLEQKLRFKQE